ncbi:MAG: hypothetical protein COT91_04595 [Candidatus Doudnabacteria bacterium CG10_big_fil_rev_8_21_14_0_10_41_10]|uniref:Uncharacterized protein n=1 Tax=Candidatus Doudnabacteria bacterium CG10_big_fil_rev_8_21_14_0_10_41_10 TaxID=1974551 RepID=A0A2H0VCH7_9BACT|nr:MAG: hypothetical protein COT91_04595 [Candidatus Doudnabacteria bacterium CG10_big_fil_rev_8_21_14_0_10_41_10]
MELLKIAAILADLPLALYAIHWAPRSIFPHYVKDDPNQPENNYGPRPRLSAIFAVTFLVSALIAFPWHTF